MSTADRVEVKSRASARASAERVLRAESAAILSVADHLDEHFDRAVEIIGACTGSVIVSGMGKSGLIGQKISATLSSLGTPSHVLHPSEAMHGDLGRVRRQDVVMLLSYSGGTEEVAALGAVLRQDGVKLVGMTRGHGTPIARLCDAHLVVGDLAECCPNNLAPTASTTAMLALGDALAVAVSERGSFSADDFRRSHPGGTLGRMMMPVSGIMRFRVGEGFEPVSDGLSVEAVLRAVDVPGRRPGAVVLVDEGGVLSGILTDADVRRLFLREGAGAMSMLARDAMTRSPKRLGADALVRDAVQLVREVRLDEIPVVDAGGRPVGLLDVQDLVSMRVIEG